MKLWKLAEPYSIDFAAQFPEIPGAVLQLLWNRGLREMKEIDEFLYPDWTQDIHDPFLFRDMKKACGRLYEAIDRGELVAIFADYDADGVCAGACLYITLQALGAKLEVYLPHREIEGYGLNSGAVKHLSERGAKIIITCDCGISNKPQIDEAAELGIDVIITDHHTAPKELPRRALALIHPKLEGETYPFKHLSGGGVAFKLAQALVRARTPNKIENPEVFEKWLLDLVAVSTVADMVPLSGESRTLVKHGLIVLRKNYRLGFKKMFEVGRIKPETIDTGTIGFGIAPRINAAGRMNHANVALKLLVTENEEEAARLAKELEENNVARQKLTTKVLEEAQNQIVETNQSENVILFLENKNWPLSLAGLVAGKLTDKYHRPTLLICDKGGQPAGSGRSIPEFNLITGLQEFSDYFQNVGGHPAAAGFTLKNYELLPEFKQKFSDYVKKSLAGKDLSPQLKIDAKLSLGDINWELYDLLAKFEPFGMNNPAPRYLIENVTIERVDALGENGQHLRLQAQQNGVIKKMIGFCFGDPERHNGTNWCTALKVGDKIDVVCEIGVNEWNGNRELQLKLIELKCMT